MSTFSTSRNGFLISGILFTILGIYALRNAHERTIIAIQILGALYAAAGLAELFYAFKSSGTKSVLWRFALGAIYLIIGLFMLIKPLANALSLTLMSLMLAAIGFYRIYDGIVHYGPFTLWRIINGLISIIIGIILCMHWHTLPYPYKIGILLGIELVVSGLTSIAIALFADN